MPESAKIARFVFVAALTLPILSGPTALAAAEDKAAAQPAAFPDSSLREEGEALLYGFGSPAEPQTALDLLRKAGAGGDQAALVILGENLIWGIYLARDVPQGLALLEQAIAAGDNSARVALGKLYLYGGPLPRNRARARDLFEAAAANGEGAGLHAYGAQLMWSWKDPDEAERYLRRAADLGDAAALSTLAEGAMYGFLGLDQRRRFEEFATEAVAAGETRIAVLDAQRRLYGINMRASGPLAIEGLEKAARAGNADAARFLIALVRDGNRYNVRKRPAQAEAYLREFAPLLSETEQTGLAFTIEAARTRMSAHFDAMAAEYYALSGVRNADFAKQLFAANPNFVVYLLQKRWQQSGDYKAKADGLAGQKTFRALRRACRDLPVTALCRRSLLHPDVIAQLLAR